MASWCGKTSEEHGTRGLRQERESVVGREAGRTWRKVQVRKPGGKEGVDRFEELKENHCAAVSEREASGTRQDRRGDRVCGVLGATLRTLGLVLRATGSSNRFKVGEGGRSQIKF